MAVTLRFHSSGAVPGDGRPIVMRGQSLTIGRGQENDVVLPDMDRQISRTHCVLESHNGNLVAVDLSTNGTFLNYGKIPLGRTPTPLNHGDVLVMGPYELVVEVTSTAEEPPAPLADDRASFGNATRAPDPMQLLDDAAPGGDFLDDLLGTPAPKGPAQFRAKDNDFAGLLPPLGDEVPLLGPAAEQDSGPAMADHGPSGSDAFRAPGATRSVIPDDWDDVLAPSAPDAPPPSPQARADDVFAPAPPPVEASDTAVPFDPFATDPNRKPKAPEAPVQQAVVQPPAPPVAPVVTPPSIGVGRVDAARVFLSAVGAEDVAIADADLPATMGRLGRTMKAMITGLREILMTRASIKSEFRIEQTMITVGSNNPLKFSISPEQAIDAMVRPQVRGYLAAEEAAAQALEDVKAHEVAMVTGMEAALKGVLARLDPKALADTIETRGGSTFLKNRKAQYWETYEAMYAEISDQAENDFNELFAREFAKAYKEQLARLKTEGQQKG
jgi:type VI secretion system protein